MTDGTEGVPVRVRTARARSKARGQLRELLRDTSLVQTLVVACNEAGEWTVLAGGMQASDIGRALLAGTTALERVIEAEGSEGGPGSPVKLDASIPTGGPTNPTALKRTPEIRLNAEGELQAPAGETFIFCGECGASRWYVTSKLQDDAPGRYACVHCGNEIGFLKMHHRAGTA